MALPHSATGSLRPGFPPVRPVGLTVKLPCAFTLYGWFPFSLREPSRASVIFWRRPPQSNCPAGSVPNPDNGLRLEVQNSQGGISRLAPLRPESQDQSLPPILRRLTRTSLPTYSKGSWGLSVLPRVEGIFTPNTISLSH